MAERKDVMVELNKDGRWAVRTTGKRAHDSYDTQAEAMTYAKLLASKYGSEVRVKNTDNKVRIKQSFKKEA